MKTILALALLGICISFCKLPGFNKSDNGNNGNNSNNTNNTNSESSPKDKFIGTWEHPADGDVDLLVMTINRDDTFTIQRNRVGDPRAKTSKGKYTVRDDRLFLDGEVGREVKEGLKIEGGRLVIVVDGGKKSIYFNKK